MQAVCSIPGANYSFNYAPDCLPRWLTKQLGHFEVFGIGRFFRVRVSRMDPLYPALLESVLLQPWAFTSKSEAGA